MKRIRKIYGIVLSAALILAGLCLIGACVKLYLSGGDPIYSPEAVAAAFRPIAIPVFVAIGLVLGSIVLQLVKPEEKKRPKVEKNYALILRKLHEKQDVTRCGDEKLRTAIANEQKKRKLHTYISYGLLICGAAVFLIYGTDPRNFPTGEEITGAMVKAALVFLGCAVIPLGYGIFAACFRRASIRREVDLMKLVAAPRTPTEPSASAAPGINRAMLVRVILLCAAVGLVIFGYATNGWSSVVTKAINICRECVGLG